MYSGMENKTFIYAVDDEEVIVKIIQMEFENDDDYKFRFFTNPVEFLTCLTDDLDLVIMDVNMGPDFDVVEAVKVVDEMSPLAYVIVISGDKDFNTLTQLTNLGIFRFCEKDGSDFLPRLRKYIKEAHRKITIRKGLLLNGV